MNELDDIIIEGASGKDKADPGKDKPPDDPGKHKGASVGGTPQTSIGITTLWMTYICSRMSARTFCRERI